MLSFYFKSLSFKNPLTTRRQFYISVEIAEGAPRTTEAVFYFPRTNFAIFSETLEFSVKNPKENTFFHLEIYEENDSQPKLRICRETIHLNKMHASKFKELQVNTKHGPATLELTLDLSEEFNEMVLGNDKPLPKAQTQRREQAMSLDSFNLLKMAPLMYEFVLALTPLVLLKRDVIAFFTWKDPHKTLWSSIGLSLFILFNQKILAVAFLLFFVFSKRLIPLMLQAKPVKDEVKGTLNIYKRNMVMMRELMQLTVFIDELQNKLFNSPDKTHLLHILLFFKRFAPALSLAFFFGDMPTLFLLGYWTFLLYHSESYHETVVIAYKFLSDYLELFSVLLIPFDRLEQAIFGSKKSDPANNPNYNRLQSFDSPKNYQESTNADPKTVLRQKTFITYENQRWWITKGWCTRMIGNERPAWSDDLGKVSLSKEGFKLPGPNWMWDTDWTYVVNSNTDALGWEYANKFSTFNKPDARKHLVNPVRRRKWVRRCVEVKQVEEPSSPTGKKGNTSLFMREKMVTM